MNREILFRGKRRDNGEWVCGDLRQYVNMVGCEDFYEIDTMSDTIGYGHSYKVDRDSIGQYTGLTDNNGKKIFEGDIVDVYSYQNGETKHRFGSIGWYEGNYLIFIQNGYNETLSQGFCNVSEVIGNIHDNPELLTDKQ